MNTITKSLALLAIVIGAHSGQAFAADALKSKTTYAKVDGETKNAVLDPATDLPRLPAIEPKDAVATWKVKPGFAIQLAAHEPQVRAPVALCFDENGRMFVCEMLDYPESRDLKPHLGRISLLEDKDGDGFYESSTVFAGDLPWPTGLIWANDALYVCATPDIWRFEDKDGDGKAEVREKVFTGFGPGNNVDALMNSLQWGQDNRIHLAAGLASRGQVSCAKGCRTASIAGGEPQTKMESAALEAQIAAHVAATPELRADIERLCAIRRHWRTHRVNDEGDAAVL